MPEIYYRPSLAFNSFYGSSVYSGKDPGREVRGFNVVPRCLKVRLLPSPRQKGCVRRGLVRCLCLRGWQRTQYLTRRLSLRAGRERTIRSRDLGKHECGRRDRRSVRETRRYHYELVITSYPKRSKERWEEGESSLLNPVPSRSFSFYVKRNTFEPYVHK